MRDFHHLKRLECDPCSFLHQGIMLHPNLAPPNLETLALRRYSKQPEDFFDDLPKVTPYTYLPSLKQLEFIQPMVIRYPQDHRRHANYICHPDRLRERHASAYQLWKCGVNMKILAEMQRRASWIPPYLHGEIPPEPIVVYDAAKVGFLRFIDDDRETEPAPAPTGGFQTATGSVALPPQRIANKDRKFFEESPKETDKLTKADIERLHGQVGRLLTAYCSAQGMGSGPPMVAYYGGPGWELTDNIAGPNFGGLGVVVATGTMYDLDSDMSDDDDDWMVPDAVFANLSQASAGEGSDDASQDHNAIGNDAQADDIGDDEHDDENDDDLEDSEDDSGDDSDSTMGDSGDSNVDDIDAALDEIIDAVHDEFHAAAGDYIGDVLADASGDHIMDVD